MFSEESLRLISQLIAQVNLKVVDKDFIKMAQAFEALKKELTEAFESLKPQLENE